MVENCGDFKGLTYSLMKCMPQSYQVWNLLPSGPPCRKPAAGNYDCVLQSKGQVKRTDCSRHQRTRIY